MLKIFAQLLFGIATCCLFLVNGPCVVAQSPSFPYTAKVADDTAIVRSGPGTTHYGTEQLPPGTEVTIYRHDPGGWMAIRPSHASFSLVQKDEVELLDNGFARVKHDDTVAWVGTRLDPVDKPLWQVKLRGGEMLKVLGEVDRDRYELGDNEPDWVQVSPPRGEFRWIAAADLATVDATASDATTDRQRTYGQNLSDNDIEGLQVEIGFESDLNEQLNIADSTPAPAKPAARVPFEPWDDEDATESNAGEASVSTQDSEGEDWSVDIKPQSRTDNSPADTPSADRVSQAPSPAATGWRPAQQTISNFVNQRSSFMAESAPTPGRTASWSAGHDHPASASNATAHARSEIFDDIDSAPATPIFGTDTSAQTPRLQTPDFGNSIAPGSPLYALDQRLTQELLKPPVAWDLIQLAADVQRSRDATTSPDEIAAADRLLEKIRKCREVQAGYRATGNDDGPVDLETRRTDPARDVGIAQTRIASNDLHYNYDASGYLNELVRDNGTGPTTFVLQDVSGNITHQISAPPGLNLRRYLNQRVGIIGNRGFNQQLNLDHVTAERVIAIDTLRR